ncbi:MAG: hypothetical protein JXQ29_15165 [Planctomycetes bacterium]|nr:hypothetical protein [Planctomycetota bacterium]
MAIPLPYRLRTVADIQDFFGGRQSATRRWLLSFARQHPVVTPPLLKRLPERIELGLLDVKPSFRTVVRSPDRTVDVEDAVAFIGRWRDQLVDLLETYPPDHGTEALGDLVREGLQVRSRMRKELALVDDSPDEQDASWKERILGALQTSRNVNALLVDLMRCYLSTRNPAVAAFLEKGLLLSVLHGPRTVRPGPEWLDELRRRAPTSSALLDQLYDFLCRRFRLAVAQFYRPWLYELARLSKDRILRVPAPPNLRRGALERIEEIRQGEKPAVVRSRLATLLDVYRSGVPATALRRLTDVVENFLEKLPALDRFLETRFELERLERYRRAYCLFEPVEEISVPAITNRVDLVLYPCKDYHDLLKGQHSGDCTREHELAARHLRNPRFLNLRIFHGDSWIGNVYVLDYTATHRTIVLDRIQLQRSAALLPAGFLGDFLPELNARLATDEAFPILGPRVLSNSPAIQESYRRHRLGFETQPFHAPPEDRCFESVRDPELYVLRPGSARRPEPLAAPARALSPSGA